MTNVTGRNKKKNRRNSQQTMKLDLSTASVQKLAKEIAATMSPPSTPAVDLPAEKGPRQLPEGAYDKSEPLQQEIMALVSQLKVVRTEDVVERLGLNRTTANYHLQKMSAAGEVCIGLEPHRGQNRYIVARDFRVIAEMVEPSAPRLGEGRPARA